MAVKPINHQDMAVAFDNVAAARGGRDVYSQLSFAISSGSLTALVGPNGAGKTTLMEALLGLIPPRDGSIRVFGMSPRKARIHVGYVPQSNRLIGEDRLVGREFVTAAYRGQLWGLNWRQREVARAVDMALEQVDALDLSKRRLSQLSGGQRRRLLIAQALVNRPRLLLMDEPLAQLDAGVQAHIVNLIARLRDEQGLTVLLSTHDINPLIHVTQGVLYLVGGRGCAGRVDEVLTAVVLSRLYLAPMHVVRDAAGSSSCPIRRRGNPAPLLRQ